jgi:uncharacterized protein
MNHSPEPRSGDAASGTQRPWSVVTGASSGIGQAFARRLGAEGHDLLLVARRAERLRELAAELAARHGASVVPLAADLATPEGLELVRQRVVAGPPVRWLVHSAGFGTHSLFAETDPEKPLRMTAVHVMAPLGLVRAALPAMLARREGRIVLLSSLASFFTTARYAIYSATKASVTMFAQGLAAELQGTGVHVQALCPGLTRTEFLTTPEYADFNYQQVPAWAWMTPEQVVDESFRSTDVVLVPGRANRVFVGAMQAPLLGSALGWALRRLNRDGLF